MIGESGIFVSLVIAAVVAICVALWLLLGKSSKTVEVFDPDNTRSAHRGTGDTVFLRHRPKGAKGHPSSWNNVRFTIVEIRDNGSVAIKGTVEGRSEAPVVSPAELSLTSVNQDFLE